MECVEVVPPYEVSPVGINKAVTQVGLRAIVAIVIADMATHSANIAAGGVIGMGNLAQAATPQMQVPH